LTDSMAYSTWRRRPSGDQTVTSVSYMFRNIVILWLCIYDLCCLLAVLWMKGLIRYEEGRRGTEARDCTVPRCKINYPSNIMVRRKAKKDER
jgi:hypothetical protein